ncbi:hypothetical protein [Streptomyces griseus]|uniref:hypothetical protein n=1 Tax=Streptomyces griseus TaxID=1911 RepID=UPI003655175B
MTRTAPAEQATPPKETRMPRTTKAPLDTDEERVTRAQRLLLRLGAELVVQPFNTRTHDELARFLSEEAAQVLTSLETLRQRPEPQLRQRISELAGHTLRTDGGMA